MNNHSIEPIPRTDDGVSGLIIDGMPHLYWYDLYSALGLSRAHAFEIISKLQKEKHFISFSKHEFKSKYPTVNKLLIVSSNASNLIFINEEGYNRAIMEIKTGYMNDPNVVARIEEKKNHIAEIYTRWARGELPVTLNIHRIGESRNELKDLNKSLDATISENIDNLRSYPTENERNIHAEEHTAINIIVTGSHKKDLKYDLNSTGLEAMKTAVTSDEMGILCEVFDSEKRHGLVKHMIDKKYPNRNNIMLNDTERALLSRKCDETQKLIDEFASSPAPVKRVKPIQRDLLCFGV